MDIYETSTGRRLGQHRIDAKVSPFCSLSREFETDREIDYAPVGPKLAEALTPLQPDDAPPPRVTVGLLTSVCSGGKARGAAQPEKGSAPLRTFLSTDPAKGFIEELFSPDLTPLSVKWQTAAGGDPSRYGFVACIAATRTSQSKTCEFSGGSTLTVHGASYAVNVLEARTGKKVASRVILATAVKCPPIHNFNTGASIMADPGKPLAAFLSQFGVR